MPLKLSERFKTVSEAPGRLERVAIATAVIIVTLSVLTLAVVLGGRRAN